MEEQRSWLVRLVNARWIPCPGLSREAVFQNAEDVRFAELSDDDKVWFCERVLWVDQKYPEELAQSGRSKEEQQVMLLLYVTHEAVHRVQGIAKKAAVTRLRSTDHESMLMLLDLAADHAAVQIVSQVGGWGFSRLRDLQGRSVADFPLLVEHSFAAQRRKIERLVSLRLDLLVREHRPELDVGGGFVFAAFGAGAGPFQVFTSDMGGRLLHEAEMNEEQARILYTSLSQVGPSIDGLDRCLLELIRR